MNILVGLDFIFLFFFFRVFLILCSWFLSGYVFWKSTYLFFVMVVDLLTLFYVVAALVNCLLRDDLRCFSAIRDHLGVESGVLLIFGFTFKSYDLFSYFIFCMRSFVFFPV